MNARFCLCCLLTAVRLISLGRPAFADEPSSPSSVEEAVPTLLKSMPANSGETCFGISLVMETLLEAETRSREAKSCAVLANEIYTKALRDVPVECPLHIRMGARLLTVEDRESLAVLSEAVTALYVFHFREAAKEENAVRIERAESQTVADLGELNRLLDRDGDGVLCLAGFGTREFPGKRIDRSCHCFLLERDSEDQFMIHDSNAPGSGHAASFYAQSNQLHVCWKCCHRNTSDVTNQDYVVVPIGRYLQCLYGQ